jgi:hypothetical protein
MKAGYCQQAKRKVEYFHQHKKRICAKHCKCMANVYAAVAAAKT